MPVSYTHLDVYKRQALHRPSFFPTPAFILKLALGEAAALALNSYHVTPKRLLEEYDFKFKFDNLSAALADLFAES